MRRKVSMKNQANERKGCKISHIIVNGIKYERKKVGDETHVCNKRENIELNIGTTGKVQNIELCADITDDETCPSCNVRVGQYHHWGCDMEECPACRGYVQHCECAVETAGK